MTDKLVKEYEKFLEDSSWYAHAGERNIKELSYLVFGLCGETGEFTDHVKKLVRERGFELGLRNAIPLEMRVEMIQEIADVLWYVTNLARVLDVGLNQLMLYNTAKLYARINGGKWDGQTEMLDWPFSDPMKSEENVNNGWQLLGGKRYDRLHDYQED